jgi:hypothetical protein
MKIEITIEVEDVDRHGRKASYRPFLSWFEKSHYAWQNATIVVDGDTVLDWRAGTITPRQLESMRREVVSAAVAAELGDEGGLTEEEKFLNTLQHRHSSRLGKEFQEVVDDYKANPNSEWAKKLRRSAKSSIKRREKQMEQYKGNREAHEVKQRKQQDLIKDLVDYEIARQDVLRSNGQAAVSDERVKVMVESRVEGMSHEDPTPTTPEEEKTWKRICRSAEAEATFDLPRRFHLVSENTSRHVSFDFQEES